jgi:threonine/homoserine/homoserine lactone efflux protein
MPQFIDPHRATLPQVLILGGTFDLIAAASLVAYIVMVTRARRVAASARAVKMINRAGGTMLIGAGLLTATLRHRG